VVRIHLVGLDLVRIHLVGLDLVRLHLVRLHLVRLDLVRQRLDGGDVGLTRGSGWRRHVTAVPRPVAIVIVSLIAAAVALDGLVVHLNVVNDLHNTDARKLLLAVAAFAVAEAVVLHVELGRDAHSISVAEIALSVALFFVPSTGIVIARLIGGGVALLLVRKQRPIKVVFNASVWLLDVAAATAVFRALHGGLGMGAGRVLIPGVVAALTAAAVDSAAVNVVIATTSGEVRAGFALRFLGTCLVGAFGSALLGVVCVTALAFSPWLLIPICLMLAVLMVGLREFAVLKRRHNGVTALYEFTGSLSRVNPGLPTTEILLSRVVELMRVDYAEVWIETSAGGSLHVAALRRDGQLSTRRVSRHDIPALVAQVIAGGEPRLVDPDNPVTATCQLELDDGAHDVALASIDSSHGVRGALLIADRLGEVSSLNRDDLRLLQALALHAGTALANVQLIERLDHGSRHDGLTGLSNRIHFKDRLDEILRTGKATAVMLMDLDRFKEVNDTLGHHYGDLLLQKVALRLSEELGDDGELARLGGDEFAVAVTGRDLANVEDLAQRLRSHLSAPLRLEGFDIAVTASVGIAWAMPSASGAASADPVTSSLMLQWADVAMYAAKRGGRGVHVYQPELDAHSRRQLAIAGGLPSAISRSELSLRYQPQVRTNDGELIGCEALLRWEHPIMGELGPDEFVSIAEQTGQIRELTRAVLELAVEQLATWTRQGLNLGVSVNFSVRNLLEADLPDAVAALLATHDVPAGLLTVEVTESQLMADPARTRSVLDQLDRIGVRIAVDDFGTGYSSLAYLKQMPVAELKIDKTFINDLATDGNDAVIVQAIIQLAHALGVCVVAEGVEDAGTLRRLDQLSCDRAQGFHIARPMTAEQLDAWIAAYLPARGATFLAPIPSQRAHEIGQVASAAQR
jgi:diguanylate cyclase (GGDEF)-like protein